MRVAIFGVGAMAMVMGITVESIYGLWFLCADLVYVMLFPQLLAVVHIDFTNTYGSLFAYIVGLILRIGGGEPLLNLKPLIRYPMYDEELDQQKFPFRTLSMLVTLFSTVFVSFAANFVFERGILQPKYDIFRCVVNIPEDKVRIESDVGEMTVMNARSGRSYDAMTEEEAAIMMANGKTNPALDVRDVSLSDINSIEKKEMGPPPSYNSINNEEETTAPVYKSSAPLQYSSSGF